MAQKPKTTLVRECTEKTIKTNIVQSMGKYATVFQAEVHAIELCARENMLRNLKHKKIYIMSDSQAALKALQSRQIKSKLVWDCIQILNKLSTTNKVSIQWVPGHSGIEGNEIADRLAGEGSSVNLIGPEPYCGLSKCVYKSTIQDWSIAKTKSNWDQISELRHSKEVIPSVSKNKTKQLLQLSRRQLKIITEIMTGHGHFNKHLFNLRISQTDICRFCNDDKETGEHIICKCNALHRKRMRYLGQYFINLNEIWKTCPKKLIGFYDSLGLQ